MGKFLCEPLPRRTAAALVNTHWLPWPDIRNVVVTMFNYLKQNSWMASKWQIR